MKRALVTGGMGYIGSHTVVELFEAGYEVDILDNLANSKVGVLDKIEQLAGKRPGFYNVDLRDYEGMRKVFAGEANESGGQAAENGQKGKYDLVLHFAGLKAVAESVEKPLEYYEVNVGGTINLLKCMKEYGVKKMVFSSSATVYGEQEAKRLKESAQTGVGIANPYGRTKYMIEEILKDVAVAEKDWSIVILRYFNPIGNHGSGLIGEDPNGIPNNLMPIVMKVATGEMAELKVYGDDYPTVDGSGVRDYIHVVDLAKGHVAAIDGSDKGVSVYNLGTGRGTSVLEMVAAFEKVSGKKLPYAVVGRRAGDLAEVCADPGKAEQELGWKTELTIEDAMRDTLKFLENSGKKLI